MVFRSVGLLTLCVAIWMSLASAADTPSDRAGPSPLLETIELGRVLVEQTSTHPLTREYVGAALNCTSCHLENGTHPTAATFLKVASAYPAWSPREETVVTLEDRVLNCFMRSCNGTRPPPGSTPAVAGRERRVSDSPLNRCSSLVNRRAAGVRRRSRSYGGRLLDSQDQPFP